MYLVLNASKKVLQGKPSENLVREGLVHGLPVRAFKVGDVWRFCEKENEAMYEARGHVIVLVTIKQGAPGLAKAKPRFDEEGDEL